MARLALNEPQPPQSELVDDQPEVAEDIGERLSDVDSGDEEEIALVSQAVETEDHAAASGILFETEADRQANSLPGMLTSEGVPPAQTSLQEIWRHRNRNTRRLPPISILLDTVDGRQQLPAAYPELRPHHTWSILRKSMSAISRKYEESTERLPLDGLSRVLNNVPADSVALATLNGRRYLSPSVIALFGEILMDEHNSFPLLEGEERPRVWVLPPCAAHLSPALLMGLCYNVGPTMYVGYIASNR